MFLNCAISMSTQEQVFKISNVENKNKMGDIMSICCFFSWHLFFFLYVAAPLLVWNNPSTTQYGLVTVEVKKPQYSTCGPNLDNHVAVSLLSMLSTKMQTYKESFVRPFLLSLRQYLMQQ